MRFAISYESEQMIHMKCQDLFPTKKKKKKWKSFCYKFYLVL